MVITRVCINECEILGETEKVYQCFDAITYMMTDKLLSMLSEEKTKKPKQKAVVKSSKKTEEEKTIKPKQKAVGRPSKKK